MTIELRQVFRAEDYADVWDANTEGQYDSIGWTADGETVAESESFDRYIGVLDGVEVARVELEPQRILDARFRGIDTTEPVVDLWYLEVATHRRREGIGEAVVAEVVKRYPGRLILAFSHADAFWSGIGWTARERLDPAPNNSPLFSFQA
jgi:GNAT superfamily N-acetyltransferase